MSNRLLKYLKKFTCTDTDTSLESIDGMQVNSQVIQDPIMSKKEEAPEPLKHQEELIKNVCTCIKDCYPNIKKLHIKILQSKTYLGEGKFDEKSHTMFVTWQDSVSESIMRPLVWCVLEDYCESVGLNTRLLQLQLKRSYSDAVILNHSKSYANCIAPNIPLNMHNIHCFKVGGVAIYELVIGELNLMDEVKF